jgi:uncharacterized integral membrane protein (TIGR00697 family)
LVCSNLLGSKLVDIFGITVSVGIFVFPFTFIASDVLTEVFGKKSAQDAVIVGIAIQIYVLFFVFLGGLLPASPQRDLGHAYETMFGLAPRMVIASIIAYSVSQFLDVKVFAYLKKRWSGRFLILRTNLSTWLVQVLDTFIFLAIFLGGVLGFSAWWKAFLFSYVSKMIVATFDSPFVNLGVWIVRRLDHGEEK